MGRNFESNMKYKPLLPTSNNYNTGTSSTRNPFEKVYGMSTCMFFNSSSFDNCDKTTEVAQECLSSNNGLYRNEKTERLRKINKEEMKKMGFYDKEVVTQEEINLAVLCDNLRDLILYKNDKYNNSVLEPLGIFPSGDAEIGVYARINDKLGRIFKTTKEKTDIRKNDVVDLIGYLVLLCKAKEWNEFEDLKD